MSQGSTAAARSAIKPIDKTSIHRITSGQVVIDLQTAVKELVENSLDAGATNIEVKFKQYGLTSIEVVDNGCGIAEEDHESIGLKHHTSKLAAYADLTMLRTFGFRGEALSSLCALCQSVQVTTSTNPPVGTCINLEASGKVKSRKVVARPKGTTVTLKTLFHPLPVRRKELEKNIKREFAKALGLLNAYALLPCATGPGIRLVVTNQLDSGSKSHLISTQGAPSIRASASTLWGPKSLDNIVDLDLEIEVERERGSKSGVSRKVSATDDEPLQVRVRGLISKFSVACGRAGTDRQFFYVNGRPCTLNKIQKTFNEVYRSFNPTQSPLVIADFILPTHACDINVSPDKRTIFLHSEGNLIAALKLALEHHFSPARSTFDVAPTQSKNVETSRGCLPTAQSRLTVTNNMLQANRRVTSLDDEPNNHQRANVLCISTPSQPPDSTQPHATKEVPEETSDPQSKLPLFIPDPEDDLPRAEADMGADHDAPKTPEQTSKSTCHNRHQEVERGDSGDDVHEVIIDTTQASWNFSPPSKSIARPGSPFDRDPENGVKGNSDSSTGVEQDEGVPMEVDHEQETDEVGPARKKRKVSLGHGGSSFPPGETESSVHRLNVLKSGAPRRSTGQVSRGKSLMAGGKVREGQLSMHQFLAGFASRGSQSKAIDAQGQAEGGDASDSDSSEQGDASAGDVLRAPSSPSGSSSKPFQENVPDATGSLEESPPTTGQPQPLASIGAGGASQDEAEIDELDTSSVLSSVQQSISSGSALSRSSEPVPRPEIIRSGTGNDITLKFDIDVVKSNWAMLGELKKAEQLGITPSRNDTEILGDAGLLNTEDEAKAAEVLSRIIDKTDFTTMDVVGQFNLGFIIARREKADPPSSHMMDDLFIVDQHAADEKYNFETLQQTTNIQSQKLFSARSLELTAADELVATENIDVLRKNGFELDIDETALSGSRLRILAQPVSKGTIFDVKDLEELIHLMRDRPSGQMVRCSKARAMFAMRACRKSIMIGMPLNRHQMLNVVRHMGTMDQPWNCPHGRPTMRHLVDLAGLKREERRIDWNRLMTGE